MEALNILVKKLVAFWKITAVRRNLWRVFLFISFTGSLIKNFDIVPESYFSNSKNVLNVYFVKVSWAWHLFLLLPFIALSNSHNRHWSFVLQRLSSQLVSTAIWYIFTGLFFYIEDVTGVCSESHSPLVSRGEFTSKAECQKAGFRWEGYDISGHSFILSYSTLVIAEELVPMVSLKEDMRRQSRTSIVLDLLYVALNAIVTVWIWMFGCTSVYFHDITQKLFGTAFGLVAWYITYRVWYLNPFSPGLPPQRRPCKQHA
ncbi:acyl-coenzyme A diphosphatase FITM2 [Scleropages formosus]|nr:fat storage-inducing transmembrane protein 2 [Scleropages formosus]